jgi:hypothetical protein
MHVYQYGAGGIPAYSGVVMQRGYGLGGIFKGLIRAVAPHVKSQLKNVGKQVLKTGLEVIGDVTEGGNIKTAVKRRSKENFLEYINPRKKQKTSSTLKSFSAKTTTRRRGRRKKSNNSNTLGIL